MTSVRRAVSQTRKRKRKKTDRACIRKSCFYPRYPGLDICRRHARKKADALWSDLTPKERCEATLAHKCGGSPVSGHGFSRIYSALRWDPLNRFVICSGLNWQIESRFGLQWDSYLRETWGQTVYDEMRRRALSDPEPDLAVVIVDLRQRIEKAA